MVEIEQRLGVEVGRFPHLQPFTMFRKITWSIWTICLAFFYSRKFSSKSTLEFSSRTLTLSIPIGIRLYISLGPSSWKLKVALATNLAPKFFSFVFPLFFFFNFFSFFSIFFFFHFNLNDYSYHNITWVSWYIDEFQFLALL